METVIINKKRCILELGKYPNGTTAITAYDLKGEPWWTCSINWEDNWNGLAKYKKLFKFPNVVLNGMNENEGVPQSLEKAGVVELGAYMERTMGKVQTAMITEKWQKILKPV